MHRHSRILGCLLAAALLLTMTLPAGAAAVKKTIEVQSGIGIYLDDSRLLPKDASGKTVDVFSTQGTTYVPARRSARLWARPSSGTAPPRPSASPGMRRTAKTPSICIPISASRPLPAR